MQIRTLRQVGMMQASTQATKQVVMSLVTVPAMAQRLKQRAMVSARLICSTRSLAKLI
jgi:hypothetical protein